MGLAGHQLRPGARQGQGGGSDLAVCRSVGQEFHLGQSGLEVKGKRLSGMATEREAGGGLGEPSHRALQWHSCHQGVGPACF